MNYQKFGNDILHRLGAIAKVIQGVTSLSPANGGLMFLHWDAYMRANALVRSFFIYPIV